MASTTRQALLQALSAAEGAYISGQQLARCRAQGGSGAYRAGLCAGSRLPPGVPSAGRRPLLHRGGRPLPRPGAAIRHAGKHQPHRKAAGAGRRRPRHAGAGGRTDRRARAAGAQLYQPGGQGGVLLGGAAPAAACRQRPDRHQCAGRCRRCAGWNLPSSG